MGKRIVLATGFVLAAAYALAVHLRNRSKNRSSLGMFKGSPRLPRFALPSRYDVELRPDLKIFKFSGKLVVLLDIVKETSHLVLNAVDMTITANSVWFRSKQSREVLSPISIDLDKEDEILVISFLKPLPIGEAIIAMEFVGNLNDYMKGFYRSSYIRDREERFMAVTQFEPADARRCFPCWDEPSFKATFKITVEVSEDRTVLSNMPVEEERTSGSSKLVLFQESPKMSTYLVAVVVGELEYIESETTDGIKVRVFCEAGKIEQAKFALDIATKILPFYAEYFGTAYPLPKLDMVAVPDFYAGAMENYGLVTYQETELLYDEKHSSAVHMQRVAIVVAHELAHQWFGNLVTMEWWTHLWLNEGFATWVSYLAVDHLFPEWNIWTQFIEETCNAFRLDGLIESHPIEVEVGHVREINEIFDAICYVKGASIIRMLQTYLGPETFQKGLISYIRKHAYGNASTGDLWDALLKDSGEPVRELMDSWTKQKGYPVLSVQLKQDMLEVEQSQYLSSGLPGSGEWVVPVTICHSSSSAITTALIRSKTGKIALPSTITYGDSSLNGNQPNGGWLKLNAGQSGFYRVQYDEVLGSGLRRAIASGSLTPTDRLGILDDTYALCSACKQHLSTLLSLMDVYREETNYTVLTCLINVAYRVCLVVGDSIPTAASSINRFSAKLLQYAAEKLGWEACPGESHLDTMLRGELLTALVSFGHEETIIEATRRFNIFLNDRNTPLLGADTRNAAYKAVMQKTNASDKYGYESLLRIFRETNFSEERVRILRKITSCPDPAIVREALDFCLSSEVRSQDAIFALSGISREGRETAWLWLKCNWDSIWGRWGETPLITCFIRATTRQFSSDEKAEEIEAFSTAHGKPSIERTVNQSIEQVRITAQWVKHIHEEDGLQEFIEELAYRNW